MKGFGPAKSKLQKTNVLSAFNKDKPKTAGPQKITIALKSTDKIENDVQTLYPVQARPSRPAEDSEDEEEDNGDRPAPSTNQSGGWTGGSVATTSVSQHIMEAPISSLTLRALQMRFAGQKANLEAAQKLLEKTDMFDPLLDSREARVKALKAEIEFITSRLKQMEAGKTHEDIEEEAAVAQAEAQAEAARESERTLSLAKNFISWAQGGVYTGESKTEKTSQRERERDRVDKRKEAKKRKKMKHAEKRSKAEEDEEDELQGGEDFFEFDTSASEEEAGSEDGEIGVEKVDFFTGSKYMGKIRPNTIVEVLYTQTGANQGRWIEARIEEAYPPREQGIPPSLEDLDYEESYLVTWLHPTEASMVLCPRYRGGSSAERGKFSRCPDKDCSKHHGSRYPIRRIRKHRHYEALMAAKGEAKDPSTKDIEFSRGDVVLALHRSAGLWFEAKVLRVKSWAEALNNNVQVEYKIDDDDNNRRKWVSVHEVTVLPESGSLEHLQIVISAMDQRNKFRQKRRQDRREKRQAQRAIAFAVAKRERDKIRERKAARRQRREAKLQRLQEQQEQQLKAEAEAQAALSEAAISGVKPPPPPPPPIQPFTQASAGAGSLDQYINKLYGGSSSLDAYVNNYQPEKEESNSERSESEESEEEKNSNNTGQKQPLGRKEKARLVRLEKTQKRKQEREQKEQIRLEREKKEKQEREEKERLLEIERIEKERLEKIEQEKKEKEDPEKQDKGDKDTKKHKKGSKSPKRKHKKDRSESRSKKKDKKKNNRSSSNSPKRKKKDESESRSPSTKREKDKKKTSRSRSTTKKKKSKRSRDRRKRGSSSDSSRSKSSSSSSSSSEGSRSRSRRKRRRKSPERRRTPSAERKAKKAALVINEKMKQAADKEKKLRAQIERAQELISAVTSSIQLAKEEKLEDKGISDSDAEVSPDPVSEEEKHEESESAPSDNDDDGGIFKMYEWTDAPALPPIVEPKLLPDPQGGLESKHAVIAEEHKEEEGIPVEGNVQGGPSEDVPKPPPPAKIGDWEQHTKGIGLKLLTKMGFVDGVGLGKSQQGRLEPIPVDAELSNQTLSLDFHTNAKLRAQAEASELESRKEKKRKQKKKLLHLPTQRGIYTTAEKVGEFGLINSLFGSSDPVGEEVTDMDARPEPAPVPKKINSMGFISGGNMPEHGEGPPVAAVPVAAPAKGKISDMFMLEQDIAYQKEKVGQLTEQFLRHKNDWTAGPIFKQSLVEAKGKLAKLESQMTTLQGTLRHDRDKKNKHSKTKKLF